METINVNAVKRILNNSRWETQWCHPDRWSDSDQEMCIAYLEDHNWMNEPKVNDYVQAYFFDIIAEKEYDETGKTLDEFAAYWIADPIASSVLPKDCYFPESATFTNIAK